MNIAVFTKKTTFHGGYGGLETLNKVLCEGLVQKGHKITVFSPRWELEAGEKHENGIKYVFVDCVYRMGPVLGFFGSLQKENWINRSAESFERYHGESKFDLVLAQSSAGLGVIKNKQEYKVAAVSISHGSIVGEYKTFVENINFLKDLTLLVKNTGFTIKNFFRRQREFVHGSNKIVAVSNFVKNSLIEETYVQEDKVEVIFNGVDPKNFYEPKTTLERGKKLLYVGQIIKSKGVKDIIEMFSDERLSGYEIDLVGGGELLEECQYIVSRDSNLKGRVNFVGKVRYEALINRYFKNPEYGLFLFPTNRYEGLPMVLVESMFSGLPVVAYNKGGVSDAVKDGVNGFLTNPQDIEDFKDKVIKLINNRQKLNEFAANALEMAYQDFTIEKMLNRYEKVINEVVK